MLDSKIYALSIFIKAPKRVDRMVNDISKLVDGGKRELFIGYHEIDEVKCRKGDFGKIGIWFYGAHTYAPSARDDIEGSIY